MANSIVITGSTAKNRTKAAQELAKAQSSQFDIAIFDTQEERGIDLSKKILQSASRRPFQGQVSTIIVLEAQDLTNEAQNALLKTLEEPAESSSFILTATSKDSLLPTIASRCSEITLESGSETESKNDLSQDLPFSNKLELLEKTTLDQQIIFWEEKLSQAISNGKGAGKIQQLHRYNKTLLKLRRAEAFSVNKKLLTLIAALETPNEA